MSHTKEVQLSWQPDARREQKRAERYRAAIETGDHLLPWQRKVVAVVEQADTPIVIVSVPRAQGKSWLGVCAAEKADPNMKWIMMFITTTGSGRSCRKSSHGADS